MDGVVALPGNRQGRITPVRIREWTGLALAHPEFSCREPSHEKASLRSVIYPSPQITLKATAEAAAKKVSTHATPSTGQSAAFGGVFKCPNTLQGRAPTSPQKLRPLLSQGGLGPADPTVVPHLPNQKSTFQLHTLIRPAAPHYAARITLHLPPPTSSTEATDSRITQRPAA